MPIHEVYNFSFEIPINNIYIYFSQGMKTIIHPRFHVNSALLLVGVGMRKKTFLFINVDVYLIAINIAASELAKAKSWSNTAKESLSDVLLSEDPKQNT